MNSTAATWFNAMTLKVAGLEKGSVRSVDWKQALQAVQLRVVCFAYHRDEYFRLVREGLEDNSDSAADTAFLVAPINPVAGEMLSFNAAMAAAQLLAAAQSLYAACECLFRVACSALGLNLNVRTMATEQLSPRQVSEQAYGQSKIELDRLRTLPEFQYLEAFVSENSQRNLLTAKWRTIGTLSHQQIELSIREFQHTLEAKAYSHHPKWAIDFLCDDCEKIIECCNRFGGALANEMV